MKQESQLYPRWIKSCFFLLHIESFTHADTMMHWSPLTWDIGTIINNDSTMMNVDKQSILAIPIYGLKIFM